MIAPPRWAVHCPAEGRHEIAAAPYWFGNHAPREVPAEVHATPRPIGHTPANRRARRAALAELRRRGRKAGR